MPGRIKRIAAHLLQCRPDQVRFKDGRIEAGQASIEFSDIGRAWYLRPDQLPDDVDTGGLEVTEGYKPKVDGGVFSTHRTRSRSQSIRKPALSAFWTT